MIAFAMGPLSSRLQTLCLANATAAISRLSLRVVWLKDEGTIYVPPSEILLGGGGGASGGSAGGGSARSRGKIFWGRREPKRGAGGEVTMAGERGGGGANAGGRGGGPVVIDTGGTLSPVTATRAFLAHPFVPKTCGQSSAALDPSEAERLCPALLHPHPFPFTFSPPPSPGHTRCGFGSAGAAVQLSTPLKRSACHWTWVSPLIPLPSALTPCMHAPPPPAFPESPDAMRFGQCGRSIAALDPSEAVRPSLALPSLPLPSLSLPSLPSSPNHQMRFGQCGRSSAVLDPSEAERLSLDVWVSVRALNRTNFVSAAWGTGEKVVGCLVLEEFHRCYARLQPFLPSMPPVPPLYAAPLTSSLPQQQEKVVGCLVLEEFHRCYARLQPFLPVMPPMCPPLCFFNHFLSPQQQEKVVGCSVLEEFHRCYARLHPLSLRASFALPLYELFWLPPTTGEGGGVSGAGGVSPLLRSPAALGGEREKEAMGVVEEARRVDAGAVERARRVLIACQQHEFAELLLLANTRAMLHMRPSPAADFIRARALARNPSFRMLPPVCHVPPISPIPRQLFAKFFVVEPSLNLAYCGLPKVACTSWRMWLRAMLHLPKPEDHFLAHSYEGSGLGDLSQKFTEKEATVFTSLNLAYCGLPKVACTSWRMWLRAMLHLPKPEDHFLAHSYEGSGLGDLSQKFTEKEATVFTSLNLAYCGLPKVACTSWRMWLRAMLHLPKPEDHFLAHSYEGSGLGDLSQKFTEKEATVFTSLNLAYCGLPKVACTSWRMWLRAMLHLPKPEDHFLAHSYEGSGLGDLSQKFTEKEATVFTSLNLAYCGLPKVACTSWRMWLRAMLHLPKPEDHFLAHSYEGSGLGDLSQKFTEKEATVFTSLNLAYCGLPKVACTSWRMWLRAMLHLPKPEDHFLAHSYEGSELGDLSQKFTEKEATVFTSLNLAYCGLPKVACTSWRMWLRAMLHLPKPEDHFLAHSYEGSGLGDLSQKFTEKEATVFTSLNLAYCGLPKVACTSWRMWLRAMLHLPKPEDHFLAHSYEGSGLGDLSQKFTEKEATVFTSLNLAYCGLPKVACTSWRMWLRAMLHLPKPEDHFLAHSYEGSGLGDLSQKFTEKEATVFTSLNLAYCGLPKVACTSWRMWLRAMLHLPKPEDHFLAHSYEGSGLGDLSQKFTEKEATVFTSLNLAYCGLPKVACTSWRMWLRAMLHLPKPEDHFLAHSYEGSGLGDLSQKFTEKEATVFTSLNLAYCGLPKVACTSWRMWLRAMLHLPKPEDHFLAHSYEGSGLGDLSQKFTEKEATVFTSLNLAYCGLPKVACTSWRMWLRAMLHLPKPEDHFLAHSYEGSGLGDLSQKFTEKEATVFTSLNLAYCGLPKVACTSWRMWLRAMLHLPKPEDHFLAHSYEGSGLGDLSQKFTEKEATVFTSLNLAYCGLPKVACTSWRMWLRAMLHLPKPEDHFLAHSYEGSGLGDLSQKFTEKEATVFTSLNLAYCGLPKVACTSWRMWLRAMLHLPKPEDHFLAHSYEGSGLGDLSQKFTEKEATVFTSLNLAYCGLPKVACTSWRMWLRAMLHLPKPEDHFLAHSYEGSGLGDLSQKFTEKEATVFTSLNLAYCGLPKVACTSWRMWLRAMLHLPKPEDHFLAHSYEGSGLGDLSQKFTEKEATVFTSLNLAYCGLPKVACTSWRMWLRAMLHLPKPEDHFLAHSYEGSGLGDLSQKFTEKEATVFTSLNLAYCGLPKVACTSWRMWLRAMLHLPKPEDHFLAHSYEGSGLGDLSQKFTEKEATVFTSLNLAYCGLPKVACTSWRMWLRAMLHLPKPEDHFLAHSYEGSGLGDLSQKFTEKEATVFSEKWATVPPPINHSQPPCTPHPHCPAHCSITQSSLLRPA
ncbi:unnamed protein product [Closterium sp. Naga37s-1]|nr:unnamed protein product [Closterium sp. Naga37s-1]